MDCLSFFFLVYVWFANNVNSLFQTYVLIFFFFSALIGFQESDLGVI